jgi:hypothetical protein
MTRDNEVGVGQVMMYEQAGEAVRRSIGTIRFGCKRWLGRNVLLIGELFPVETLKSSSLRRISQPLDFCNPVDFAFYIGFDTTRARSRVSARLL